MSVIEKGKALGRAIGVRINKHLPEILVGTGIISFGTAVVLTAKQTPKAIKAKNDYMANMEIISNAEKTGKTETGEDYTEEDKNKDSVIVKKKFFAEVTKIAAPVVGTFAVGTACVIFSDHIQNKRLSKLAEAYGELASSYAFLGTTFAKYRESVREAYGEEKETEVYEKSVNEAAMVLDEEGYTYEFDPSTMNVYGAEVPSVFTRMYDESAPGYSAHGCVNYLKLRGKQDYWTMVLEQRYLADPKTAYVTFNEVLKDMHLPEIQCGMVSGWFYQPGKNNNVSFGLDADNPLMASFRAGETPDALLVFNAQPNILKYLPK